jgi:hypothetical protein
MAKLFFPQLATGALVQYPVKRTKAVQTVSTQAEDGSVITHFDPRGSRLGWQLEYAGITQAEADRLQNLFESCAGRFRAFTFIDPVANLLNAQWQSGTGISSAGGVYTNTGNSAAEAWQTFSIPSGYTYCFSLPGDLTANAGAMVTLIRRGSVTEDSVTLPRRDALLVSSGALEDAGLGFTVAVRLQPGQSVELRKAQLEAQPSPSLFRPPHGGVYPNAHWAVDELVFTAIGPDLYSTKFSIETDV